MDLSPVVADLQAGRLDRADAHCQQLLQGAPGNADALGLLAVIRAQRGHPQEAVDLFTRALAARPDDSRLYFNRATLLMSLGETVRAEADYREAMRRDPANLPARINLGRIYLEDDRLDEAEGCFGPAAQTHPTVPETQECLGILRQRQGQHAEAADLFRRALALAPGNPRIEANLGWALLEAGQAEAAIAHFQRATATQPGVADLWVSLGAALMRAGRWAEAEPALGRSLACEPTHTRALALQAMTLDELGRPAERRRIVDLEALLWRHRVAEPPPGFADMASFNQALYRHVTAHPSLIRERSGKTTRNGSQTGDLLDANPGPVAILADLIRKALDTYAGAAPSGHPLFAARPGRWRLRIWGTVLGSAGHQDPHHHPSGWVSGVYYVRIPPEIGDTSQAGWIEFGRPDPFFGSSAITDLRLVQPQEGEMLLFPSYVWHRTIPFTGDRPRVSIAFDIVPLDRGR